MSMQLSENFTLEEFLRSPTARRYNFIEQFNPPLSVVENLRALVKNVLQPVRTAYGQAITVTSGYRCPLINSVLGGALKSQHLYGEAADLYTVDNALLFELIVNSKLPFDQLIWEFGNGKQPDWIHVSYSARNRREVLKVSTVNGKKVTEKWKSKA